MDSSQPVKEVRERLEKIFPAFLNWLEEESIFSTEAVEGEPIFTECGLFMELVHFLDAHQDQWQARAFQDLADLLEEMMLGPDATLTGAADICFLETVAGYIPLADTLRPHLKPRSRYALLS